MERQKSAGFVLTSTENNLVGYLYKDEWGDSFSVNKPWDNYELDREVLLNINKKVLMD